MRLAEAVRRSQWQVSGIARTLVDAADDNESQPAPTQRLLESCAQVLDEIAGAIGHFGLPDAEREAVAAYLRGARKILARLGHEVRTADLKIPGVAGLRCAAD